MPFKKLLKSPFNVFRIAPPIPEHYSNKLTYDELVNAESVYGRTIFGPIPAGHQREFFEHRKNIWIWHESWTDVSGQIINQTIRYEVRPTGVFKKAAGDTYRKIEGKELDNFVNAAKTYLKLVKINLYN
ncbi:hypothetical protein IKG28_00345 [Candidatus Saccharibacteria bacterium]|nr:hypothetical protein [Candidatus Saccharibacteria bacterium]